MKRNLLVTSLLCVLGMCAWANPTAQTLELSAENDYRLPAADPNIHTAAVVGNDDRVNITGQAEGPEKAVVVLEMKTADGKGGGCSGSLIAPNVVLTAAHCLWMEGSYIQAVNVYAPGIAENGSDAQDQTPNQGQAQRPSKTSFSDELRSIVQASKNKKGSPQTSNSPLEENVWRQINKFTAKDIGEMYIDNVLDGEHQAFAAQTRESGVPGAKGVEWWVPTEWKRGSRSARSLEEWLDKTERYDYGIIILEQGNVLGQKIQPLRIADNSQLQNMGLVVIGRGGDKPKKTLWKGEGMIKVVEGHYFMHDADMKKGNSGGPAMLIADRYTIVGLNNFHFSPTQEEPEGKAPNGCLRINDKIITVVANAKAGKQLEGSSKTDKPSVRPDKPNKPSRANRPNKPNKPGKINKPNNRRGFRIDSKARARIGSLARRFHRG